MYDVDLFETKDAEMAKLHQDGRVVICYFSAGSWGQYRPDSGKFPDSVKGSPLDPPFADELWLDIRSPVVRDLMKARLDLAVTRGCDGVEPDNVDGYSNDNGLKPPLTAAEQLDFNKFIAAEAHARARSPSASRTISTSSASSSLISIGRSTRSASRMTSAGFGPRATLRSPLWLTPPRSSA